MTANAAGDGMRDISRRILALEAAAMSTGPGLANGAAADRVFEALRRPLCVLAGSNGFRALLARALVIAKTQDPELAAVSIKPGGSIAGLTELGGSGETQAGAVLVSHFLGLLATLIGDSLTRRILVDIWPALDQSGSGPTGESAHD